jgi:DNA-binding SARP family transcriptional activator
MLELRTLGGLELRRECEGNPHVIPLQLKRLVLLAYLAAAPGRTFRRRDAILGLFWPERDEGHARGSLRQALHSLRRGLGEGVILTRGEGEIGLADAALTWDGADLQADLARGDPAAALARYHGDFLAGVFVSDASPELDEWIAQERTRLRRVAATAAWAASALPGAAGDAAHHVRWAVRLSGDDEEALRRGLLQLDRMGDRAGAVALYDEVAQRVGRQLEVELSAETRAVLQAIRARRPAAPKLPESAPASTTPVAPAAPPLDAAEPPLVVAPSMPAAAPRAWRRASPVGVALLALLVLVLTRRGTSAREPVASGDLVAILPFQVAADSSLAPLREGMVELLGGRLSEGGGPRVVDAPVVLGAWSARRDARPRDTPHDLALDVARRLGAGRVIEGSVVGSGARVTLGARLTTTAGAVIAEASVDGARDSVPRLVDRLAAHLLGAMAGVDQARLVPLADGTLPAVRAYLAGHEALRQGRVRDALLRFLQATELDSTFALAGLEMARAVGWPMAWERLRGVRMAGTARDRLPPEDRVMLDAIAEDAASAPDLFALWNRVLVIQPRHAGAWLRLGELHYHLGPLAGDSLAFERAWRAMRVSDSLAVAGMPRREHPPPPTEALYQMVELAQLRHDSAMVRALAARVLARDSTSDLARALRWHVAVVTSDSARRAYWDGLTDLDVRPARDVGLFLVWSGIGIEEYPQYVAVQRRLMATHDPGSRPIAFADYAYNGGRPGEAPDAEIAARRASHLVLQQRLVAGLYWDGDTGVARAAARELSRSTRAAAGTRDPQRAACALGQWWAAEGDWGAVDRTVATLRAMRLSGLPYIDSVLAAQAAPVCAAVLDAIRARALALPDARARAESADSLARTLVFGVAMAGRESNALNLLLARLWEAHGEPARALQAARRRGSAFVWVPTLMTTYLAEEGRLAALVGDTAGAVRAYRHYLALRHDPGPAVRPKVEAIRAALAGLEGGRGGR